MKTRTLEIKLFDTHEERNHNGTFALLLFPDHAIRKGDYVYEERVKKDDPILGWKDVNRYAVDCFLKKDVSGITFSNSTSHEFWYVYIDVNGINETFIILFESHKEAEEFFDILYKWWIYGDF